VRAELIYKEDEMAVRQARNVSVEPQQRTSLSEISWENITQPGAYVERGSGDLYRIPKEALHPSASPLIRKQSSGASKFLQISDDPYVTTLEARMICAEHNVVPNF
jgi:hypothetical protein